MYPSSLRTKCQQQLWPNDFLPALRRFPVGNVVATLQVATWPEHLRSAAASEIGNPKKSWCAKGKRKIEWMSPKNWKTRKGTQPFPRVFHLSPKQVLVILCECHGHLSLIRPLAPVKSNCIHWQFLPQQSGNPATPTWSTKERRL